MSQEELLTQQRIACLRPLLEGRNADVEAFVFAFLSLEESAVALSPAAQSAGHHDAARVLLVRRLIELFFRIDKFGRGVITWDDITSFAAEVNINGVDGSATNATHSSVVYRLSDRLGTPLEPSLPTTRVTHVKWVPELQQLYATYADSSCVFVFNHLCRLVARLHANLPPVTALGVNVQTTSSNGGGGGGSTRDMGHTGEAATATVAGAGGRPARRTSVAEAAAVQRVGTVTWGTKPPFERSGEKGRAEGGNLRRRAASAVAFKKGTAAAGRQRGSPPPSPGSGGGGASPRLIIDTSGCSDDVKAGSMEEAREQDAARTLVWARRVLKLRGTRPRGELLRAARAVANHAAPRARHNDVEYNDAVAAGAAAAATAAKGSGAGAGLAGDAATGDDCAADGSFLIEGAAAGVAGAEEGLGDGNSASPTTVARESTGGGGGSGATSSPLAGGRRPSSAPPVQQQRLPARQDNSGAPTPTPSTTCYTPPPMRSSQAAADYAVTVNAVLASALPKSLVA